MTFARSSLKSNKSKRGKHLNRRRINSPQPISSLQHDPAPDPPFAVSEHDLRLAFDRLWTNLPVGVCCLKSKSCLFNANHFLLPSSVTNISNPYPPYVPKVRAAVSNISNPYPPEIPEVRQQRPAEMQVDSIPSIKENEQPQPSKKKKGCSRLITTSE